MSSQKYGAYHNFKYSLRLYGVQVYTTHGLFMAVVQLCNR